MCVCLPLCLNILEKMKVSEVVACIAYIDGRRVCNQIALTKELSKAWSNPYFIPGPLQPNSDRVGLKH